MARMTARFNGQCSVCGERIRAGETIEYDRAQGGARHPDCTPFVAPADTIWISIGQGYGGQPFHVGQILANPYHGKPITTSPLYTDEERAQLAQQGEPEYLYVLHASKRYFRDDGMSFGVGDEEGYVYSACCRPATEEEASPLRATEQRANERHTMRARVEAIRHRIETDGEYPRPAVYPLEARVLFNTRNIYGGGARFVVAPGEVWFCAGNGGDGDNWSENNLGSEIAHRLADPDGTLGDELQRLSDALTTQDE